MDTFTGHITFWRERYVCICMFRVDFHFFFRCRKNKEFGEGPVNLGRKGNIGVESLYSESSEFPSLWCNLAVTHAHLVSYS